MKLVASKSFRCDITEGFCLKKSNLSLRFRLSKITCRDSRHKDKVPNDTQHNDIQYNDTQYNDPQYNNPQHTNTQSNTKKVAIYVSVAV
jgi:hypothetical protein